MLLGADQFKLRASQTVFDILHLIIRRLRSGIGQDFRLCRILTRGGQHNFSKGIIQVNDRHF